METCATCTKDFVDDEDTITTCKKCYKSYDIECWSKNRKSCYKNCEDCWRDHPSHNCHYDDEWCHECIMYVICASCSNVCCMEESTEDSECTQGCDQCQKKYCGDCIGEVTDSHKLNDLMSGSYRICKTGDCIKKFKKEQQDERNRSESLKRKRRYMERKEKRRKKQSMTKEKVTRFMKREKLELKERKDHLTTIALNPDREKDLILEYKENQKKRETLYEAEDKYLEAKKYYESLL